jgi:hypothetical protein
MMHSKMAAARRTAIAAAFLVTVMSGCLSSTDPQPSLLALRGTWAYTGVQSGPVPESMTGTLAISTESGIAFQGRLDLVVVNQQTGQTRLLGGLISGTEASTSVIDFDASLEISPRRHVGQLVADTITGTWIGNSPDGTMTTGTFRAERESR